MSDLGLRSLNIALEELKAGVKEEPLGSNTGPRIKEYLAGCERNGKPLKLQVGNWCSSFASWCGYMACLPDGVLPPHLWRASVSELWRDAVVKGADHPPTFVPELGDLAIFKRDGQDPRNGGEGHVGRVNKIPDEEGNFETIDGNHNNCVSVVSRKIDNELVGFISYAQKDEE